MQPFPFMSANVFEPVGVFEPLVVDFIQTPVLLDFLKKSVQLFAKIGLMFTKHRGNWFNRKRFIEKYNSLNAVHRCKYGIEKQIVHEGVSTAFQYRSRPFILAHKSMPF